MSGWLEGAWPHHNGLLAEMFDDSYLLGEHTQFLKVDKTVHLCLIAVIEEGQVLLEDGEERDERGRGIPLQFTVLGHVMERVHEAGEVIHGLTVLGRHLLPSRLLTLDKTMVQSTQNVEHRVEILLFFTPLYQYEGDGEGEERGEEFHLHVRVTLSITYWPL